MTDFALDDEGDLVILDGDLMVGDADIQNQKLCILIAKGELREFPTAGVGIQQFLLGEVGVYELTTEIKRQLELDGAKVDKVTPVFDSAGRVKRFGVKATYL